MSSRAVVTRARGDARASVARTRLQWGGGTQAGEEMSDSGPGHSGDKGKGEDPGIDAGSPEGGDTLSCQSDQGNEGDDKDDDAEVDWQTSESGDACSGEACPLLKCIVAARHARPAKCSILEATSNTRLGPICEGQPPAATCTCARIGFQ